MNEFKTEKAVYSPSDFLLWEKGASLVISPKFQRRSVWRISAKSFFIDTILRGMTVPPIYLRILQPEDSDEIREVVDGQQRIRSVLDFINGQYRLSKTLGDTPWTGKYFKELSRSQQNQIKGFSFSSEIFKGISDQQVLEVFCRLNTNGVPLNAQELRNGKFFGLFKKSSYKLAHNYLDFWRAHRIFTELLIARMQEVELTSELLIAANEGMQDKKGSIGDFYEKWENVYPEQARDERRFTETMATITEAFKNNPISNTEFRRPPMFYTLYCVVYHHLYGLPDAARPSPKRKLTPSDNESLREAVENLSEVIVESKDPAASPAKKYNGFILHSQRQTDNINPRKTRFNTLYGEAFG